MASLTFEWNKKDLGMFRDRKVDQALTRALSKSGSDAIRAMKAAAGRSVRQRKQLKVARINRGLPVHFPRNKSDINSLVWRMDVEGKPLSVSDFPHRQTRKGVVVGINRGSRKLIKSAFVAIMKSGHRGVFQRMSKARLPIDEAFTTRISDVFKDDSMIPAVQAQAQKVFTKSFGRLLPLELKKVNR